MRILEIGTPISPTRKSWGPAGGAGKKNLR